MSAPRTFLCHWQGREYVRDTDAEWRRVCPKRRMAKNMIEAAGIKDVDFTELPVE